jgi:tRNA A-37 threonylcarbamoyl transferase component Bud32
MPQDVRLAQLLSAWEERAARGQEVSAEALCSQCPELLPQLKCELAARRSARATRQGNAADTPAAPPVSVSQHTLADPASADDTRPPAHGQLGPYRLLGVVGQGGMGTVYRAEDPVLQRAVAIKVIRKEHLCDETRQRFLQEARNAARLEHTHIVPIYQVGETDGTPFFVMPLLAGQSLDQRLRHGAPLPLDEALRIGRETAEGLAAAHAAGLVHRDIKPANVWLKAPHDSVVLLDFGLARPLESATELTLHGQVLGTPGYMAPEQALGLKVDSQADLFALGCLLYELLTRRRPFPGSTARAGEHRSTVQEPASVQQLNPAVPTEVEVLVRQLLAMEPGKRPSARTVADRLAKAAPAAPRPVFRRGLALGLAVAGLAAMLMLGVLALGGVGLWFLLAAGRDQDPPGAVANDAGKSTQRDDRKQTAGDLKQSTAKSDAGTDAKLTSKTPPGPPKGWQEYRPSRGKFVVWMPGEPTVKHEKAAGTDFDQASVVDADRATYYTVVFAEFPNTVFPDPLAALAKACEGAMASVNGKVLSEKDIKIGDWPGKEVLYESPQIKGLHGKMRIYLVGRRMYQLIFNAPPGAMDGRDANLFFDSFRLQDEK